MLHRFASFLFPCILACDTQTDTTNGKSSQFGLIGLKRQPGHVCFKRKLQHPHPQVRQGEGTEEDEEEKDKKRKEEKKKKKKKKGTKRKEKKKRRRRRRRREGKEEEEEEEEEDRRHSRIPDAKIPVYFAALSLPVTTPEKAVAV